MSDSSGTTPTLLPRYRPGGYVLGRMLSHHPELQKLMLRDGNIVSWLGGLRLHLKDEGIDHVLTTPWPEYTIDSTLEEFTARDGKKPRLTPFPWDPDPEQGFVSFDFNSLYLLILTGSLIRKLDLEFGGGGTGAGAGGILEFGGGGGGGDSKKFGGGGGGGGTGEFRGRGRGQLPPSRLPPLPSLFTAHFNYYGDTLKASKIMFAILPPHLQEEFKDDWVYDIHRKICKMYAKVLTQDILDNMDDPNEIACTLCCEWGHVNKNCPEYLQTLKSQIVLAPHQVFM
ncbi:hypothetical protein LXL04_034775 [Taraxacum kok-saghyz]